MKRSLILMFFFLISLKSSAKIWRINNINEVDADFTTAQAAHNHANVLSGDTLLFEGSPNSYGTLTMNKQLVLIGPGYFLGENPGNQANLNTARLDNISFERDPGASPTAENPDGINATSASGSDIIGLQISNVNIFVPNITIRRCYILSGVALAASTTIKFGAVTNTNYSSNANNSVLLQNFMPNVVVTLNNNSNIVVSNNVIRSISGFNGSNITCTNNIFTYEDNQTINLQNATVRNNIILGSVVVNPQNSVFSNNLAIQDGILPAGNDNQNGVGLGNLFVAPGGSPDAIYRLKNGSVAVGAGFNGVDCGIFGGTAAYRLSGIPPIPTIYELTVPGIGSTTEGLQIQVKVKSNN